MKFEDCLVKKPFGVAEAAELILLKGLSVKDTALAEKVLRLNKGKLITSIDILPFLDFAGEIRNKEERKVYLEAAKAYKELRRSELEACLVEEIK
jgi:hypothetical protein